MGKHIAILGSSGGNLYTMGGKDPASLLAETIKQINAADADVATIQFMGVDASLDFAKPTTSAHLWGYDGSQPVIIAEGTLAEMDKAAKANDAKVAALINAGQVDGLILMSADPTGNNRQAIQAAIAHDVIAAGTGGTSMANAQEAGLKVVAVSGTTGTNNQTRAVSAMYALCKAWGQKFHPQIGGGTTQQNGSVWHNISLRGILMAALPAFITMAITLLIAKIPGMPKSTSKLFDVVMNGLPVIIAGVAAKQISGLGEVAICAGVIAGLFSTNGGLIGGIICGIMAGVLVRLLFDKCLQWHFPGTTANIVAGAGAGLISGLIGYYLVAGLAEKLGNLLEMLINGAIAINPIVAGAVGGLLIWPALMIGGYHAVFLPIIMLQMSKYGNSFLGSIDMCGLVMVAAGINLASVLFPRHPSDRALAAPGLAINLLFGTYVESVYPFVFANKLTFAGMMIASTVSGAVVGMFDARGTAYVPAFLGPAMSNNWLGFAISMLVAMALGFTFTFMANKLQPQPAIDNL